MSVHFDQEIQALCDRIRTPNLAFTALASGVRRFLIAGHRSAEPGHRVSLDHLGLEPLLTLAMRLGEGSGAALALPIVMAAGRIMREMTTFHQRGVSGKESP
jgi:nicotinate-nucleotide--dimethylbenzimidazole phosphoribosyltransferase